MSHSTLFDVKKLISIFQKIWLYQLLWLEAELIQFFPFKKGFIISRELSYWIPQLFQSKKIIGVVFDQSIKIGDFLNKAPWKLRAVLVFSGRYWTPFLEDTGNYQRMRCL